MPACASSLSALLPVSPAASGPLSVAESIRLIQALKAVPDPRRRRGRRHGLQSVLLLALQAVMAGASSWVAIAQWAGTAPQALGVCGASPSAATFRRVLAAVEITRADAALTTWGDRPPDPRPDAATGGSDRGGVPHRAGRGRQDVARLQGRRGAADQAGGRLRPRPAADPHPSGGGRRG